jgi:hypothetical protein
VAAAAIALVASSAQAQSIGGFVGASYARTDLDVVGPNPKLDNYAVDGAAQFAAGSLNALVSTSISDTGGDVKDTVDYDFTGHLNGKLGSALVGGFAGLYTTVNLNVWGLGVEGQTEVSPNVVLYGQAGYAFSHQLDSANLWGLRGEARYFFTDNVKLQGEAGWSKVDTDSAGSFDTWTVGVEGEYQFAGTPWSILASYDYADSHDLDVKSNTFRIGGRYTFGGATLKARDAAGADLAPVKKLFTGVTGF